MPFPYQHNWLHRTIHGKSSGRSLHASTYRLSSTDISNKSGTAVVVVVVGGQRDYRGSAPVGLTTLSEAAVVVIVVVVVLLVVVVVVYSQKSLWCW